MKNKNVRRSSVMLHHLKIHRLIALGWLLTIGLIHPLVAEAKKPPVDDPPPTTGGQSAGSRGCGLENQSLQQVMPPLGKTQTNSTTPTLVWYHENPKETMLEFRVFEYDVITQQSQLVVEVLNPLVQRINDFSILTWPESLPSLQPATQYIWQIEIVCDPNRPSGNIFADAPLQTLPKAQPNPNTFQLEAPSRLTQTPGYDILAMIIKSKIDTPFRMYFSSLQHQTNIEVAWSQLMRSLKSNP